MRITKIYIIKKKPYKIPQNLKNDQNTIGTAKMTKMHHKCPKYPKHLKMTKMFPKSPKWLQYPLQLLNDQNTLCWKIWFCISYKTHNGSNNRGSTLFMRDNM